MVSIQSVAESGWEMVKKSGAPILTTLSAAIVTTKYVVTNNTTYSTPLGAIDLFSENSELAATITSIGAAYFAVREKLPTIADCSAVIGATGVLYQQGYLDPVIAVAKEVANAHPHVLGSTAGGIVIGRLVFLGRKKGLEMEAKKALLDDVPQDIAKENEDIESHIVLEPQKLSKKKLSDVTKNEEIEDQIIEKTQLNETPIPAQPETEKIDPEHQLDKAISAVILKEPDDQSIEETEQDESSEDENSDVQNHVQPNETPILASSAQAGLVKEQANSVKELVREYEELNKNVDNEVISLS